VLVAADGGAAPGPHLAVRVGTQRRGELTVHERGAAARAGAKRGGGTSRAAGEPGPRCYLSSPYFPTSHAPMAQPRRGAEHNEAKHIEARGPAPEHGGATYGDAGARLRSIGWRR